MYGKRHQERVLPQWMVEAAAESTSASDASRVKDDTKCERGKLRTAYVMSPRELEGVARRVMDESEDKKRKTS